jgi:hypothetical protein
VKEGWRGMGWGRRISRTEEEEERKGKGKKAKRKEIGRLALERVEGEKRYRKSATISNFRDGLQTITKIN